MELIELLIAYTANSTTASKIASFLDKEEEKVKNILVEFQKEWENAECDAEGPTTEQDAKLDSILEYYEDELKNL